MIIRIGNRVYTGNALELAQKVANYKLPKNSKTVAIIAESDEGEQLFIGAVKATDFPFALTTLIDLLQQHQEELDICEDCPKEEQCPKRQVLELILEFGD